MNPDPEQLCGDPLFQLNLGIWLAQPAPAGSPLRPVFHESGLHVYSIGLLLALPPALRLRIRDSGISCRENARPELILADKGYSRIVLLECKKSSFGAQSSTADQAKALLLLSGPVIAEVIGRTGAGRGIASYMTRRSQVPELERTLQDLRQTLAEADLEPGACACIGIARAPGFLHVEFSPQTALALGIPLESPAPVLALEDGEDPRPLYFIPFDPSVFNDQSDEERKLCRRILLERVLSHVLRSCGSAVVPAELLFKTDDVLAEATFGLSRVWDDKEARRHLKRLVHSFFESLRRFGAGRALDTATSFQQNRGWLFSINDARTRDELVRQIGRFRPEQMDLGAIPGPPGFFDED